MPTLPFQALPVAPRERPWDATAAERRVRQWATTDGGVEFSRYRRAFLWVEPGQGDTLGGYKFPIADFFDGRLRLIPRGVFATAGGRGIGASSLSSADKTRVKALICRYYSRLADQLDDENIVCPFREDLRAAIARLVEERIP